MRLIFGECYRVNLEGRKVTRDVSKNVGRQVVVHNIHFAAHSYGWHPRGVRPPRSPTSVGFLGESRKGVRESMRVAP